MSSLEDKFTSLCNARDLPGVVLTACNTSGKFYYQKAFGKKSPTEDITVDATFVLASCTKLITSIAALQCVEKGQIRLDDDVSTTLTELQDIKIITGFEEGSETPIFKKATKKITLRRLLTHSSGLGSDASTPILTRWRLSRGESLDRNALPLLQRISTPLVFEPGSSWEYGSSLDWVGILVARLNNTSLQSYMQTHIFDPLGIRNITFHLEDNESVRENMVTMSARGGVEDAGAPAVKTEEKVTWMNRKLWDDPIIDERGGGGGIGSAGDFIKIQNSLCANDRKLLSPSMVEDMFSPQLEAAAQESFSIWIPRAQWHGSFGSYPVGTRLAHGLGGILVLDDLDTGLSKGTMTWTGMCNTLWTIDRKAGLCLFYGTNVIPYGDVRSYEMQQVFEKEMYTRYGGGSAN